MVTNSAVQQFTIQQYMKTPSPTGAWLILLLCCIIPCARSSITMDAGNTLINTVTYYAVYITDDNSGSFDANGWTIITFPSSDYTTNTISSSVCNISCSKSSNNYNVSNSLFISNALTINITNILNPGRSGGRDYSYAIYNSAGVITDQQIVSTLTFTPGSLQSCLVGFSPNNVRKIGTTTVTIVPGNPVLAGGSVYIRFPKSWTFTINTDQPIANSASLSCSQVNGSVTTILSCSLFMNGSDYYVIFNSPFSADVNSSFSLTINPVMSIPASYNSNEVSVYTQDSLGNLIDASTNCSTTVPNPNTFTITTSTSTMVSRNFTPILSFRASDLINSNDTIRISLPSEISFLNTTLSVSILDSGSSALRNATYDSINSNSTLYAFNLSFSLGSRSFANSNANVNFTNLLLLAPPTTKPSGGITISLYRSGWIYSTGTISITALSNALTSVNLTAASYTVNRQTTYNLSFTLASPLSSTGSVTVQLPTTVTATNYTSKSCLVFGSTNVASFGQCAMSGGVLTVSSAFTGIVPLGTTFSVVFDGVANPESTSPTSVFRINTYYDSTTAPTYPVDTSATVTLTATADTVVSFTVTPASHVVNAVAVYTVVYTLNNHLPIGGYVILGLPIGLSLQYSSANVMVSINSSTAASNTPTINSTSNGVYSTALNFSGLASTAILPAGTNISFQISSIVNPSSTKPSNTFSVYSFLQGFLIQSLTSGVTVTMTTPAAFNLVSITPNSKKNGDATFYIISIMPSLTIPVGSTLQITIPSAVTLTSPTCSNVTNSVTLTCTYVSNVLSILLTGADLLSSSVYSYQVNGFTNPRTMTASGSFAVSTYTSENYIITQGTAPGIANNVANNIVSLTSTVTNPTQSYLNSTQTIQFNVTTKNPLMSTDYILVTFPTVYNYTGSIPASSSICTEPSANYNCLPLTSNNLTVKITGNWNNETVFSFHITSYRSPSLMQYINMTTFFVVYTKQSDDTDIDVTNSSNTNTRTTFTISCDSNCQTCGTPITNCTTCYPETITNSQFLQNNVCVSICATGNYSDSASGTCKACVSPCLTCTSSTVCLSCVTTVANKYFNSQTSTCVSVCPTGYYGSVDVCVPCSSLCLTCSGTSTYCESCNTTLYVLHNNTCISTCPTGYFNSSGTCFACDISCLTCQNSATYCLTCSTGYVRNGTAGVCTNTCSVGTVPYNGSCSCLVSCLTCSGTFNNCLTCDPNQASYRLFYSNSCLGSCPTGTYENSGSCTTCPSVCSVCSSATVCTACSTGYYLYNSYCLSSCPSGTYVSGSACLNCTSPCATCSNLGTNCTSCVSGKTLQGGQCLDNCSLGSIPVSTANGSVCTTCTPNCSTCSGSLINCTSCLQSSATSLLNGSCLATCPTGTTSVLSKCEVCVSPCLTCNVTTSNCLSCLSNFYKVGQAVIQCVTNCTSVGLYANGTDCISCQSPCSSCNNTATNCTSCISSYYLSGDACVTSCGTGYYAYQGNCITSCPNGTVPSGSTCADPNNTNNTATDNLTNTLSSSKIIPFPFIIADCAVLGLTIISKFSASETCMPGMAVSFGSLLEYFSWVVVLIVIGTLDNKLYLFKRLLFTTASLTSKGVLCILIGGALHYILNIINFAFYLKYIATDVAYQKWLKTPSHSRTHKVTLAISFLVTYKFSNLPFSKCFGSSCFKAPLSKPIVYTPMNIITGIGFIVSILMIVGCSLIIYDSTTTSMSSLFIQSVDVIVVTTLIMILAIWNFFKTEGFFDQDSKFNTASDQVYNDTLAGMVNNQSEFGERFSLDEIEEGKVGNRNYSRINDPKRSRISSKLKSEIKDGSALIYANNSQNALNIHQNSSEYASQQNNLEENLGQLAAASKIKKKGKDGNNFNQKKTENSKVNNEGNKQEDQQGKSSSIIDKMKDSSDFAVDNDEGLDAINPDAFKKPRKKAANKKSPLKKQEGTSESDSPGKSGAFKKFNKVAPMVVSKNRANQQEDSKQDEISITSSENRMKVEGIQWEENSSKKKLKKSKKNKSKSRSKSKQKKNIRGMKDTSQQEQDGTEQQRANRFNSDKDDSKSPKYNKKSKSKSKSPGKVKQTIDIEEGGLPKGLSKGKSNQSVKIKHKPKADTVARDKSLNIQNYKKNRIAGEDGEDMQSVDLDEIVPSIPSELPTLAFPQSGDDDPRSQTMGAGSPHNKKFGKKNRRNPHNEKVFSTANNASMIKELDAPDELPSKPILGTHNNSLKDFEKSKITKVDDDFVNKIYNDAESLRSVQDANIQFNEISPSEFNVQNQRFESSLGFALPNRNFQSIDKNNPIPEKGSATVDFQREEPEPHVQEYQFNVDRKLFDNTRSNFPKGLSPQHRQQLPAHDMFYDRQIDQYKSFSKLDAVGYDGVYQRVGGKSEQQLENNKKLRDLQKIYLQRLDIKNQSKRRTANSAFNKKNFSDEP